VKKAFSLMELMVVIMILGLLAMFILPNLTGKSEEAKAKITCIQMRSIGQILKMYNNDHSIYPTTEEGLEHLSSKSYFDGSNLPKDSWDSNFIYLKQKEGFEIISMGPNKQESGGDDLYYSKCINK